MQHTTSKQGVKNFVKRPHSCCWQIKKKFFKLSQDKFSQPLNKKLSLN